MRKLRWTLATASGLVMTVLALNMNNEAIVTARRRWSSVGWHRYILDHKAIA
ncbi:hypothetical protein [Okeania sp.]|uniref:hypothetical protein n=1 Tax=Okeania sp. TaxID=3100323 RepID=UPI002B4ADF6B|nr:hypothetical protein [Okeania sp.]MEB3342608.1 hypothetical protein [Okeania sp.]